MKTYSRSPPKQNQDFVKGHNVASLKWFDGCFSHDYKQKVWLHNIGSWNQD